MIARAVRVLGTTCRWMVVRTSQQCQHTQYQLCTEKWSTEYTLEICDQNKQIKEKKGRKKRKKERRKERKMKNRGCLDMCPYDS